MSTRKRPKEKNERHFLRTLKAKGKKKQSSVEDGMIVKMPNSNSDAPGGPSFQAAGNGDPMNLHPPKFFSRQLSPVRECAATTTYSNGHKRTVVARNIDELPEKCVKLLDASELDHATLEKHWAITLNILRFKSKLNLVADDPVTASSKRHQPDSVKLRSFQQMTTTQKDKFQSFTRRNPYFHKIVHTEDDTFKCIKLTKLPKTLFAFLTEGSPKHLFKISQQCGKGGFGKVYLAYTKDDSKAIAIKKMGHETQREIRRNINEVYIHQSVSNPNIAKFYQCHLEHNKLWLCMEYLDGITLRDITRNFFLEEEHIVYFAKELLEALVYLHWKQIIYRDLKSSNVMLTVDGEVKIIDFGLSVDTSLEDQRSHILGHMAGSPFWMAPEMIKHCEYDFKVDLWSFGICLVEMANGEPPCRRNGVRAMFTSGTEGFPSCLNTPHKKTGKLRTWSSDFQNFLSLCLQYEAKNRPDAIDLLQHPFILNFDKNGKDKIKDLCFEIFS